MKRRQVLKNLGLGAGALVMTPTILSLLQSCTNEPEFIPVFLSKGEGHALRRVVDLIIPSDEKVPGAVDVGVHSFIDSYYKAVMIEKDQALVRLVFTVFADTFRSKFEKELEAGKPEEFDQLLAKYLKSTKEEQKAYDKKMDAFYAAYATDPTTAPDPDATMYSLLSNLRGMTTWAWKSSEEIGKNVLWYDPIPGQQIGCLPLNEAGNGKVMSL
jgi:hypothetical protein